MTDGAPNPDGNNHEDEDPGTPRWVYVFGIIFLALIVLVAIKHLTGGGMSGHGL